MLSGSVRIFNGGLRNALLSRSKEPAFHLLGLCVRETFSPLLPRFRPHAINDNVCEVNAGVALDELRDSLFFKPNTAM